MATPNNGTPMIEDRIALRLSPEDRANLAALAAGLTDDVRRPRVTLSDTVRAALRIAAKAVRGDLSAAAGGC